MCMEVQYDFFIAGRWRNKDNIRKVVDIVRNNGFSAYCFIENSYKGEVVEFIADKPIEGAMQQIESMDQKGPFINKIFQNDFNAEKGARIFLLVLPAGTSGHIEAGIAYGLGKPCYAVGITEKTETLYNIFGQIFSNTNELSKWLSSLKIDNTLC